MKLSQIGELSLLEKLRKRFRTRTRGLILGIGDDAAVIASDGSTLVTSDMMVEGVHFNLSWTTPFQLGFKLISVNVSDIYAMGGIHALCKGKPSGFCLIQKKHRWQS